MAIEIAGRNEELAAVRAFVGGARPGFAALLLEGEAGIGKSTLWLAGLEAARERGLRVLASRPAEAERDFAFAALGDLFEETLDEVLPALSPPRRRALEIALLLADEPAEPADPRALGVAVRNVLELLSEDAPVVLAVDDSQWLDQSTAQTLVFALRRFAEERVLLLTTRRSGHDGHILESTLEPGRVERIAVGPLSVGALHVLLRQRLGRAFSRPSLLRLHEASGGNPFYALELARGLDPASHAGQPLPVPESLGTLLRARLGDLPAATRNALVVVAAHGRPSTALLEAAGVGEDALGPALAAGVLAVADGSIRFTHPLLASTLYQGLSDTERRRVHARLAEHVDESVERARHLGLSSQAPNSAVAAAIERAAVLARSRGAPIAAAELYESALRLTPAGPEPDVQRRALGAAEALLVAGDAERAEEVARQRLSVTADGAARADLLRLLARVYLAAADIERSIELYRRALVEAEGELAVQARIHQLLGLSVRFTEGLHSALRHAAAGLELAQTVGDDSLRAGALGTLALLRFNAGEADALALAEEAVELSADAGDAELRTDVNFTLAHILMWSCRLERARAVLESIQAEWDERRETPGADALWYLALVELRAGRWSRAADCAEHVREHGLQYTIDGRESPQPVWIVALVAAHRGELERARELTEYGHTLTEGRPALRIQHDALLGSIALWSGDPRAAAEHFAAAEDAVRTAEMGEPCMFTWRDDYVEALLQLERRTDAVALLDGWERDALRLERDWTLAQVTRCRGLVAAAERDHEHAVELLEEAVHRHEEAGDPFGRARALLALGVARRSMRRKRAAREAIEAALGGFETLGAASWAETARAELGRIGGRTPGGGLTPAERRVAELVVRGNTNREVAAALFLAERTVEAHLSHVYAKLGVRSRTELARVLQ